MPCREARVADKHFHEAYGLALDIHAVLTQQKSTVKDRELAEASFIKLLSRLSHGPELSCALMDRRAGIRRFLREKSL